MYCQLPFTCSDLCLAQECCSEQVATNAACDMRRDVDAAIVFESEQSKYVAANEPDGECPGGNSDLAENHNEEVITTDTAVRQ